MLTMLPGVTFAAGSDGLFEFILPAARRWANVTVATGIDFDAPYQLPITRVGSDISLGGAAAATSSTMNIGAAAGPINALSTEPWSYTITYFRASLIANPGVNGSASTIDGVRSINYVVALDTPQLVGWLQFMMIGGMDTRGTFFMVYVSDDGDNWRRVPLRETSTVARVNLTHALTLPNNQNAQLLPAPIPAYVTTLTAMAETPPLNITRAIFAEPILANYVRVSLYGTHNNVTTATINAARDQYGMPHMAITSSNWIDFNNFAVFSPDSLQVAMIYAEAVDIFLYARRTVVAMRSVLNDAVALDNDSTATQTERDAMAQRLWDAINDLVPMDAGALNPPPVPPPGDNTLLGEAIAKGETITENLVPRATFAQLRNALRDARIVYENASSTQPEIDAALERLRPFLVHAPTPPPPTCRIGLGNAIAQGETITENQLPRATFAQLRNALRDARIVYENASSTQPEIDAALERLQAFL